jgi:hypothetical protein
MDIDCMQRIKRWLMSHRDHPVECHMWDAMVTLWLMGWVGWIPALAFDALWFAPLLFLGMATPRLYVAWRAKAHRERRLRCDWIVAR